MDNKLAYCPFCGSKHVELLHERLKVACVICHNCNAYVGFMTIDDAETVAKKWNKRAPRRRDK